MKTELRGIFNALRIFTNERIWPIRRKCPFPVIYLKVGIVCPHCREPNEFSTLIHLNEKLLCKHCKKPLD